VGVQVAVAVEQRVLPLVVVQVILLLFLHLKEIMVDLAPEMGVPAVAAVLVLLAKMAHRPRLNLGMAATEPHHLFLARL